MVGTLHPMDTGSLAPAQNLTQQRLEAALARLPDDLRRVLVLRFVHKLDTRQTALAMETSEPTVRALQADGLRALQRVLAGRDGPQPPVRRGR